MGKTLLTVLLIMSMLLGGAVCVHAADASPEILRDPNFEETNDFAWKQYVSGGATLEFTSEETYEGDNAVLITERSHQTDVLLQLVTDQLNFYGTGKYQFTAYAKLPKGTDGSIQLQGVLGTTDGNGNKAWATTSYGSVNDSQWTKISGKLDVKWTGQLAKCEFYFITTEPKDAEELKDILIDSCSLTKLDYTGPTYVAPTEVPATSAPTATATTAPTQQSTSTAVASTTEKASASATAAPAKAGSSTKSIVGILLLTGGALFMAGGALLLLSYLKERKTAEKSGEEEDNHE